MRSHFIAQLATKAKGKTHALDGHFKTDWYKKYAFLSVYWRSIFDWKEVHCAFDRAGVEKYGG